MKGVDHIITNVATAVCIDSFIKIISTEFTNNWFDVYRSFIFRVPDLSLQSQMGKTIALIASIIACVALFIVGSLLPDIDSKTSLLGRICHIPVRHRTWTHTVWFIIPFGVLSVFVPCVFWLLYGCVLHIFFDSLSKGGICWFYPLSKYKTWSSGAQIKKGHYVYLYTTSDCSEIVVTVIVAVLAAAIFTLRLICF